MKRLCSLMLALALALLLCACTPGAVAATDQTAAPETDSSQLFTDVPGNAYYAEAVQWAVEQGVTVGTGENTFSPGASCTRAQIVTFLWRAAGSPTSETTGTRFSDVSADAYYADAVRWAVETGITVGTSADTFSPGASCTRAQIVTFLYRNADSPSVGDSVLDVPFTDVPADAYYSDAVQWAVSSGITKGTGSDTFSPDKSCTRAEAVTFLYRCTQLIEETPDEPEDPTEEPMIQLTIAGTPVEVTWVENSTVDALKELLSRIGPVTLDMSDYAGFEKGAPLPETLPQNNEPMDTDAGDIILYQGRQFVIYYDQNSWSLTPLGKITNLSKTELQDLLGAGNVTVVLSLSNQ